MSKKIIVVGGGAAGMLAAYFAAEAGNKITLLEKNEKLGKKIYITGKGRCNLTNACDVEELFLNVKSNSKFLYSAFYGFDNSRVIDFFESHGMPVKVERGNRVFPVSDKSSDVIFALQRALKEKKGLFEEADQGTIFLDEIGEMAFDLQAKLLRVLESGEFIKVGDTRPIKVNVRIIAATNRDLQKEIEAGHFREDLYYRLSVFRIQLPPLRERIEDIELYVRAFVKMFGPGVGKKIEEITPEYLGTLKKHVWKGNVRELRNVIERSMIIADGAVLTVSDLPFDIQQSVLESEGGKGYSEFDLAQVEKAHIRKVLQYTGGNKTEAARLMHIGLTTLYRKIEEYGIR